MEAVCARGHQKKFSRSKRRRLARIFQHKTALPAPNNRLQRYREARVRISGHFSSTRLHCLTSLVILLLVDLYFCFLLWKALQHSCSSWDHWHLLWKSPQSTSKLSLKLAQKLSLKIVIVSCDDCYSYTWCAFQLIYRIRSSVFDFYVASLGHSHSPLLLLFSSLVMWDFSSLLQLWK